MKERRGVEPLGPKAADYPDLIWFPCHDCGALDCWCRWSW